MKTKVKEVLEDKGHHVVTVHPDQSVYEAVQTLVNHNIGSVLVVDEKEKLVGIFTERDILKEYVRLCENLKETKVKDVMTTDLIIGVPDDEVEYLMGVMTQNKIRHIPIMDGKKVVGIISIGDLVKYQLHDANYENRYLKEFIMGKYPA